ncbi:MAG: diguanylate cyclase [Rhizobacter sp.]|nr:diguanylate cyclase [Rhizobacter sp.]
MVANPRRPSTSSALRLARQAWRLLHLDSQRAIACADKALARALAQGDVLAEGWARLARGIHLLYFVTPAAAAVELEQARACFDAEGDRAGQLLAGAGLARGLWRAGHFEESLAQALALRDEGLHVLRPDQRGILLNTIAGCYSALGHSEEALAYMFQALRDAGPSKAHGFDVVLHCNLAHEHVQLGDHLEALRHVDQGINRCKALDNVRLLSVLLINRVICLTELDRPHEALPDIEQLLALPADADGRGTMGSCFETLAVAALSAGNVALGGDLVARALAAPPSADPDEQVERVVAAAMLDQARGNLPQALRRLQAAEAMAGGGTVGLNLRPRIRFFQTLADLHEALGDAKSALAAMRAWQRLQVQRAERTSRARYQAAALQTELLRLQHKLDDSVARRNATERAKAELEAINEQLSRKIDEVEALQAALKGQATRDFLTGLFNRRHLNDILPGMLALAGRDRQPFAVAMIDLDHFKGVNDRLGHDAGDSLLSAFGELLARHMRKSDIACRYGGEEFCLLMPRTDARGAARKVNALLKLWRGASFEFGGEPLEGVSFSAGVSDSRIASESAAQLVKSADEALLAAKDAGRGRVLSAGEITAASA